jgi:hypothetical protein
LILETWLIAFHSFASWSIRRSVRNAQLAFPAEPGIFQWLDAVARDLVTRISTTDCWLQQPPPVAIEVSRHFFQPGGVHPSQESLSKVTESGGLAWQ